MVIVSGHLSLSLWFYNGTINYQVPFLPISCDNFVLRNVFRKSSSSVRLPKIAFTCKYIYYNKV